MRFTACLLLLVFVVASSEPVEAKPFTILEVQDFNSESEAIAAGWIAVNSTADNQQFGFSNTDNVSPGNPGEAGGRFTRTVTPGYYADTTLQGISTFDNGLLASGQLFGQAIDWNSGIGFGWFDRNQADPFVEGFLGIGFSESPADVGTDGFRLFPFASSPGNATAVTSFTIDEGETIDWLLSYDPSLGTDGRVSLTLSGGSFSPIELTTDLTNAIRTSGTEFDSFGILTRNFPPVGTNLDADIFFDNLSYGIVATVAPEPSTIILWAIVVGGGGLGYGLRRRLKR